jgi:hypothetical protein
MSWKALVFEFGTGQSKTKEQVEAQALTPRASESSYLLPPEPFYGDVRISRRVQLGEVLVKRCFKCMYYAAPQQIPMLMAKTFRI